MPEIGLSTKAAILRNLKAPLDIELIQLPRRLDVGQVLVKIYYSGICGSQIGEIDGVKGHDNYLPHLLGHEGSGIVLEVGPGVSKVKKDDAVVLHWRESTGIQSLTPTYDLGGLRINAGWVTTFNEYSVISENRCTRIDKNENMKVAALFGCAVTTGFGVIENDCKIRMGQSIVVYGSGGIGLSIVQGARLRSAQPIIAVDIYQDKLELAKKVGADFIINARTENVELRIESILEDHDLDVFVDNTGKSVAIELGYKILKTDGSLILVGVPDSRDDVKIGTLPLHFGKEIRGSHGGGSQPHVDIDRYFRLYKKGLIDLECMITDVVPLEKINDAIEDIRTGRTIGRCLIEM